MRRYEAREIVDGPGFCLGSDSSFVTMACLYGATYKKMVPNYIIPEGISQLYVGMSWVKQEIAV